MNIELNQIFSNKQKLLFKIINIIDENYCDIQFEIDGLIIKNQCKSIILIGECLHPDKIKYKRNGNIKVFYHDCYNEALKYTYKVDFIKNSSGFYQKAYNENWLDSICKHMIPLKNTYTLVECYKIASKFSSRNEFQKSLPSIYMYCFRNNWIEEICWHMKLKKHSWSYDECKKLAKKCNSRSEFQKNYPAAYKYSRLKGWLNEYFKNILKIPEINKELNKQKCFEKALLCKSRIEFSLKYPNQYCNSRRYKILDEVCQHMTELINPLDIPRIIYCYEFEDKSIYIGLTKNFKRREISRKHKNNDTVMNHIKITGLKPKIKFLTEFIPAEEAQRKEQEFIDKYRNEGYNILNKIKGGGLGGNYQKILL